MAVQVKQVKQDAVSCMIRRIAARDRSEHEETVYAMLDRKQDTVHVF